MIGTVLRSRYQIFQDLDGEGFRKTYLAKDLDMPGQNVCVVKQLTQQPDPQTQQIASRLFQTEAETLQNLGKHDQIPSLFAYFEENGDFYLVQEFVDGQDLENELPPGKQLGNVQVRRLLQEILEILVFIHQQNVIHQDIKPSNLMRRNTDGKLVLLIDFGVVKQVRTQSIQEQGKTQLTIGIHTEGYAPYEQIVGKPKLASDIYAVGMVGIQALTGIESCQLRKDPDTEEVLWRHQAPEADPQLAEILSRMVRCHFRERYQNASEVLQALDYGRSPLPKLASSPLPIPSPLPSPAQTAPVPMPISRPAVKLPWHGIDSRYWRILFGVVVLLGAIRTPLWNISLAVQHAQLNSYLKNEHWEKADKKTADLLLLLGGDDFSLDTEQIEGLSCDALKKIDQLWIKYSEGRFGFSVQKDIYLELGGTKEYSPEVWVQFADRVGWLKNGEWLLDYSLSLKGNTSQGQLPAYLVFRGGRGRSSSLAGGLTGRDDGEEGSSLLWKFVSCRL